MMKYWSVGMVWGDTVFLNKSSKRWNSELRNQEHGFRYCRFGMEWWNVQYWSSGVTWHTVFLNKSEAGISSNTGTAISHRIRWMVDGWWPELMVGWLMVGRVRPGLGVGGEGGPAWASAVKAKRSAAAERLSVMLRMRGRKWRRTQYPMTKETRMTKFERAVSVGPRRWELFVESGRPVCWLI
jgi:hypothetical protein